MARRKPSPPAPKSSRARSAKRRNSKPGDLSVRELTRTYANQAQLDDTAGVVVTTESNGYPAAKAGLAPGDVIKSRQSQARERIG